MFALQTCRWSVCLALVFLGCGPGGASPGAPDAGGTSACSGSSCVPGPNVLPDGGSTPDGGTATDIERLRTGLQWFGANVRKCTRSALDGSEPKDFDQVTLTFENRSPPDYRLLFAGRGGGVDYAYAFEMVFTAHTTLVIETKDGRTQYRYTDGFGYTYHLTLTEEHGVMSVEAIDLTRKVVLKCTTAP